MRVFLGAHNIVSPLGFNSRENFNALLNGKTAVHPQTLSFSETPFYCAKINPQTLDPAFSLAGDTQKFTHLEKMCVISISDVLSQSGVDLKDKNTLLILSTTKGNIDVLENAYKNIPQQRAYLPEFARTIGNFFNCVNPPVVVSNACISGLLAIIMAQRFIEHNSYNNIVVCGADLVSEFTVSGFKSFNAMSDGPCKPFDANRRGINLGEAAASIVLSAEQISNIIITGGASANDANHISGPSRTGDGLFKAISNAFDVTGNKQADFISAHGTATEYNDDMESMAFSRAGLSEVPVNSLKGYYGHTLGAAGVLESIIAIESLKNNTLIKSQGFETPGTAQPLTIIKNTTQQRLQRCLKTA